MQRLEELRQDLLSRSYHPKIIEDAFRKVKLIDRKDALKRVEKKGTTREPLVVTYHPLLPSVSTVIKRHWTVMTNSCPRLKRCFQQPSVVAYKRSQNLGDMLIRSKLTMKRKSERKHNGYTTCKRNFQCKTCALSGLTSDQAVTSHKCFRTGKEWKITSSVNCQTRNCVYKLACRRCPSWVYIGETSRRFTDRLAEHRGTITRKMLKHPVGHHFNQHAHTISDLIAIPIEKVFPTNCPLTRKNRESYWIANYDSVSFGANSRE